MTKRLLVPSFLAELMIGTPVVALARQCLGELRELGRSLLVALVLGSPALAQEVLALEPELGLHQEDGGESLAVTFVGFVDGPDGAPAEGAIVVSSAGGQAVTDGNGSYWLDVHVPVGAERVQITAVGAAAANLSASTSVLLSSGRVQVGPLLLAEGGTCSPSWLPTFGQKPGVGGYSGAPIAVHKLLVFDDGSGPALYAGGHFTTAGSTAVSHIARWDGSSWTPLGAGVNVSGSPTTVNALTVFDDGSGPAVYAGGRFTTAGGVVVNNIAKWDGSSWSALGSGMNGDVSVLAVFDDGSGPALYAGGGFTTAGGVSAWAIAKWSGSTWTSVGGGVSTGPWQGGYVFALLVIDDGGGPALCVGGSFDKAGSVAANNIATWNGSSWATLGSGMNGSVIALEVLDDGSGPALYAGGGFTTAGGVAANNIATWNGSSWAPLGSGTNNWVSDLTTFDDGTGPALYAAGGFWTAGGVAAARIAKWDGSSWAPLGSGFGTIVLQGPWCFSLEVFDDGSGPALYAGGDFTTAGGFVGGAVANNIAKWDGSSWAHLGSGLDSRVDALVGFDDGSGPAIYAGGGFTIPLGGLGGSNVVRWDGSSWTAVGSSSGSVPIEVRAFAVFDDGSGPALYAGGEFALSTGGESETVARWNGSAWTTLKKMNQRVDVLAVFDDGGGPALYAGGVFTGAASGAAVNSIAKWDGSKWKPLGSGMSNHPGSTCTVYALTEYDDGSGTALYAGGLFAFAGGVAADNVAKWDGASWLPLGSGISGFSTVKALAVFDDGSGPALFAGGDFTTAGGVAASNIAKWDGSSWAPLGSGVSGFPSPGVHALTVYDDGSGPALYVAGTFTTAGGMAVSNIAKWDGSNWTPLGSGVDDAPVRALTVLDDGTGLASLYVGGDFLSAIDSGDSYLARWGCAASSRTTYCTAGTSASGCNALLSATGTPSATAASGFVVSAAGVEGSKDGQFFFGANGRQANPWGNGTSYQCVVPPVHRAGALAGIGTNGACDGAFSQDLNSRWCPTCPKPNHNPGVGATVQAQLWYRDPLSTSNQTTSLSDAIEFFMGS